MEDIYVENYKTKKQTRFIYAGYGLNDFKEAQALAKELTKKTRKEHRIFLNHGRGKENLIYKKAIYKKR